MPLENGLILLFKSISYVPAAAETPWAKSYIGWYYNRDRISTYGMQHLKCLALERSCDLISII